MSGIAEKMYFARPMFAYDPGPLSAIDLAELTRPDTVIRIEPKSTGPIRLPDNGRMKALRRARRRYYLRRRFR